MRFDHYLFFSLGYTNKTLQYDFFQSVHFVGFNLLLSTPFFV